MTGQRWFVAVLTWGCASLANAQAISQEPLSFERYRDEVEPVFLKPRGGHGPGMSPCVTCHVHNGTPLRLQPLQEDANGEVSWSEAHSRKNFEVVSRLVVPGQPEKSRLLQEPLAIAAGGARFHVGGKFFDSQDDPEWRVMAAWVRDAAAASEEPALELNFEFFQACVQQIFLNKREGYVECFHCHDAGTRGFARKLPEGQAFWNPAESRRNFELAKRLIEPGFPMMSRFLTHPLAPEAGGDHFHSGGRRWASQDDPEWQMLAAWVRGENPKCVSF